MKKRTVFWVITLVVCGAVAMPLIAQVRATKPPVASNAVAQTPPDAAPPGGTGAGDDSVYRLPPMPATSQPAVDPATVIISVGDEQVTAGQFNALLSDLPPQAQAQILSRPDGRKRLAEELVNMKLLSDEAHRRKLDEDPKTRLLTQQVLSQALMQSLGGDAAADEKFFNDNKGYFDEVKARHILIATDDSSVPSAHKLSDADAKAKAQSIKARLDKGEDFATIARNESDDTGSGAQGGDLGVVQRGKMVPAFEQAAFSLQKGQISDPVRTQFGYHIIQVTDKVSPSFTEAQQQVQQRRFEVMLDQLKKSEPVTYSDDYFGGKKAGPATQPSATQPSGAAATTPPGK